MSIILSDIVEIFLLLEVSWVTRCLVFFARYYQVFLETFTFEPILWILVNILLYSWPERCLGNDWSQSYSEFEKILLTRPQNLGVWYDHDMQIHLLILHPPPHDTLMIPHLDALTNLTPLGYRVWHLVSRLLGIETFLNFLRVSVSVSKILVSKKSLGIGLENI